MSSNCRSGKFDPVASSRRALTTGKGHAYQASGRTQISFSLHDLHTNEPGESTVGVHKNDTLWTPTRLSYWPDISVNLYWFLLRQSSNCDEGSAGSCVTAYKVSYFFTVPRLVTTNARLLHRARSLPFTCRIILSQTPIGTLRMNIRWHTLWLLLSSARYQWKLTSKHVT